MRRFGLHLWLPLTLAALLGLGGLAGLGHARWRDAGWYFHRGPAYALRHGQTLLRSGDEDRAENVTLWLEANGFADEAALLRGEAHFWRGKKHQAAKNQELESLEYAKALEYFAKIRDEGDLRLDGAVLVGQCYIHLKQYKAAETALKFVLSERPDEVDAHRALAVLYYDLGALTLALSHLERVSELDVRDGRPQRLMGLIYQDMRRWDAAVPCYQEALRRELRGLDPAPVKKELAEALVRLSRYPEALEVLQDLEPAAEDVPAIEALRAESYWGQGRLAEAREVLDRALAPSPACADLYRLRAQIYLDTGEPQPAVDLLRRAVAIDPQDHASRYHLVAAYRRLGQTGLAQEQELLVEQTMKDMDEIFRLNKEATKNPWDGAVRLRLAELCDKLGQYQTAKMWRQSAAQCLSPGGAGAHSASSTDSGRALPGGTP
jgi:tetratricopeptide (TPR) repeat protein